MKRDLDLIKGILNYSLENYQGSMIPVMEESPILKELNVDLQKLRYHLQLLSGVNFLDVKIGNYDEISENFSDEKVPNETKYWYRHTNVVFLGGLTWEGHDFLENANDTYVWSTFKKVSGHVAFKLLPKLLAEIAVEAAKKLMNGG